jgi:catechol 2,3-dioxygenase-like lactoylglutathione lyase family enzyme
MLKDREAMATVPVKDLGAAKQFYEGKLGLTPDPAEEEEAISYQCGGTKLLVYRSQFAGTNKATDVTWMVGDELESLVKTLDSKGVPFEHYDMPGMKRTGHLHSGGDMTAAWFKDPDGNIHSLVNR